MAQRRNAIAAQDEAHIFDRLAWLYDGAPQTAISKLQQTIGDSSLGDRYKKEPRVRYALGVVTSLLPQTLGFYS